MSLRKPDLRISVHRAAKPPTRSDLWVVPAYSRGTRAAEIDPAWKALVPASVQGPLRTGDFKGTAGSKVIVPSPDARPAERVVFVGLGAKGGVSPSTLRRYGGIAGALTKRTSGESAAVLLPTLGKRLTLEGRVRAVAEGLALGSYTVDLYRSERRGDPEHPIRKASLVSRADEKTSATRINGALREGLDRAAAVNLARDVGNAPPNHLGPVELADRARKVARECALHCRVLDERALERESMGALLAVGRGSVRPPRLIVLEYRPKRSDGRAPLVFVGKAITFDTGGISIKPANGMADMKFDMCGGGAVLGAMAAIGKLRPSRRVIGVIPPAENMPDGAAYRPGDVLASASGLTIEVLNTDAEGRLALADGIHFGRRYEPDLVVDVATLTGACVVALGKSHAGAFSTDEKLTRRIVALAEDAGESFWPMPVCDDHVRLIRSDIADLRNASGRAAGASTAAAFLSRFAGDTPWVHLDIAGTADTDREHDLGPKGATGCAVRTLVEIAERY